MCLGHHLLDVADDLVHVVVVEVILSIMRRDSCWYPLSSRVSPSNL